MDQRAKVYFTYIKSSYFEWWQCSMKLQSLTIKYTYAWSVHTSVFITYLQLCFSKHVFPFRYRGLSSCYQDYIIYSRSPLILMHRLILRDMWWQNKSKEFNRETVTDAFWQAITQREKATYQLKLVKLVDWTLLYGKFKPMAWGAQNTRLAANCYRILPFCWPSVFKSKLSSRQLKPGWNL